MLVNTVYVFMNKMDPQVKILFRHMVEEARMAAEISRAPHGKIFMDWDLIYRNPIHDVNTQTKGFAYWKPTRTDSKARRKIRTRGKCEGRTYIAFLYHVCQTLGMQITAKKLFKVDIRNGNLEGLEKMKVIGNLNNKMGPNAQAMLDNEKLELKEYTK